MADPIVWSGDGRYPAGLTPFGYYDADIAYLTTAPKVANYCANKLGFPIVDIELVDSQFYAFFEEAITMYGAQVNEFNIRENMLSLQGTPATGSLTQKTLTQTVIPRLVELSRDYGQEALVGGRAEYKKGSIQLKFGVQDYDLSQFMIASESGNRIEIRKVFHNRTPAVSRYFDPYATTGLGLQGFMDEMGFGNMSVAAQFVLMPVYEDMLRIQAIELNDMVRRSQYSFAIMGNTLRIFPIPGTDSGFDDLDNLTGNEVLFFEYYVLADKFANPSAGLQISGSNNPQVSDFSNVPYTNIMYSNINDVGKMWINKYTLALSKEALGNIRSKYAVIPIPGSELTLDGSTLRTEASQEKEALIKELRESLETAGKKAQLDREKENAQSMMEIFQKIPLYIYTG